MPTSSPSPWRAALAAGIASSMRSAAGPAALAARGKFTGRVRTGLLLAAAGEMVVDKTPAAKDRTIAPSVIARTGAGAFTGFAIAGRPGIAAGAVGAGAGTYLTWLLRREAARLDGVSDLQAAVGEDLLAITILALATRRL